MANPDPPRSTAQRRKHVIGGTHISNARKNVFDGELVCLGADARHRVLNKDLMVSAFVGVPGGGFDPHINWPWELQAGHGGRSAPAARSAPVPRARQRGKGGSAGFSGGDRIWV